VNLSGAKIILTGAGGGVGAALSTALAQLGARLLLVGRREAPLQAVKNQLDPLGADAAILPVDICTTPGREVLLDAVTSFWNGADILINNAGVLDFAPLDDSDPATIKGVIETNLLGPILLAQSLLPLLRRSASGRVVNIGSAFGSIGFPCFSAYCASKFGLRGFSEALRRELAGTTVGVTYVAPRAVRTPMNTDAVHRFAEATRMPMDEPEWVADRIVDALLKDRKTVLLGRAEPWFARINALLPSLVDRAIRKQTPLALRTSRKPMEEAATEMPAQPISC
jgi:short-subunit dehydrogenase